MPLRKTNVMALIPDRGRNVHCITEDSTVEAAVNEMNRLRIGSLMVKDAADAVVGVFTERDVLVRVVSPGTTQGRLWCAR